MSESDVGGKAKGEAGGLLAPVLPLRDIVVFPHMIVPLFVGREKSVRALEEVMNEEKQILLLTQKNAADDDPNTDGLHRIGTMATVLQLLKLPDQTVRVLVEGKSRARVTGFVPRTDFFQATIERVPETGGESKETEALMRTVKANFESYIKLNKKVPAETLASLAQVDDPAKLSDMVASHLSVKISDRQELLETLNTVERLERVLSLIEGEIGVLQVERKIRTRVKRQMEKTQREYYLNEQLKAIQKESKVKKDLKLAEDILNEDHFGLEKVKERILEYLAVQLRAGKMKGPILCLVGPPGVGKTSLGKSIARSTGREFVRMSLGGVRDEAEIRGHRRTYIGSMPGKVIQSMKKAKSSNPLFLLDEIDKLGADWRGDPSSALLEVLDPEQNHTFNDHYLEVDFDLSDVMFITTANTLNMPQPLMDRMEIIRIPGYTEDEKVEIAKRHLIAKEIKAHGLKDVEWRIADSALRDLIRYYTREAGVRNLEREIANLTRKAVKEIVSGKAISIEVTSENLGIYAGVRKFRYGEMEGEDQVGVVTGLAWTEVGGETLQIESVMLPGKGRMQTTGKLGDVMKESIDAARSYVRSKSTSFGIKPTMFDVKDIHVHVPEGATPKDGPSAGVAMAV
jgi:ATP-dependent Lon protease